MGKLYNCDKSTILKYARKIGYVNPQKLLTDEQRQEICNQYDNMTSKELALKYNVSQSLISKIWKENNKTGKIKYKYPFNIDYFENIDSYDKAYFLGLIASDGCVYSRKDSDNQSWLTLKLEKEDRYILYIFSQYIESSKPLSVTNRYNTDYISKQYGIDLVSNKLVSDLSKYKIVNQKTYNDLIPDIPNELYSHFIRGYFDGDGSIAINYNEYHKPSMYNFRISGFKKNLLKIKDILKDNNINSSFILDKREYTGDDEFGSLSIPSIQDKLKFINYIYNNCNDTYMSRKKYKADCFINAIKNNFCNKGNKYEEIINDAVLNESGMCS